MPSREPGQHPAPAGAPRPAVFLDRDGTVVAEKCYLADPDLAELIEGAAPAMRRLAAAGFALVVVSNQSGIARGLYTLDDFFAVQHRIEQLLAAQGVRLDGVYFCPHHPDYTGPCDCRKPATGLYLRAADELRLDLVRSAYVGDRLKDVLPAGPLGGTGYLVRTGYGREQEREAPAEVMVVDDLEAAAGAILALQDPASQTET